MIFQNSILGFVASIQLTENDMVQIGDWIEMPKYNADGDVVDITLHTVKVQNWDKTITTIPTHALVSDSFKNWRGMREIGGRRIKRSIYIDMKSIKFCDGEMLARFRKIQYIKEYLERKTEEIEAYNKQHVVDDTSLVNGRHLTNIGTFRAYAEAYLKTTRKFTRDLSIWYGSLPPASLACLSRFTPLPPPRPGWSTRVYRPIFSTTCLRWCPSSTCAYTRVRRDMT